MLTPEEYFDKNSELHLQLATWADDKSLDIIIQEIVNSLSPLAGLFLPYRSFCQCPDLGKGIFILMHTFLKPTSEMSYFFERASSGTFNTKSYSSLRVKCMSMFLVFLHIKVFSL